MTILLKQSIINTYDERQQEQCRFYYKYKEIKQQNPSFGYKRIAKLLGQPYHKTRWWHTKKYTPVPVQTVNWLENKKLIPLFTNDPKLPLITKVLGAIFGDGGIFANLNAIFLSSSELEAVKEFGEDLKIIFGEEIEKNSRIIEAGEYGHSWCYQNTNRNIIRFFKALGVPIGKKTKIKLIIPCWTLLKEDIADEFFGSFFGSEINIPKIHIEKTRLDTLSLGVTAPPELEENRIKFFLTIKEYLTKKGINSGSISKSKNKKREDSIIYKLLFSTKLENIINFQDRIKINYCIYKTQKLDKTIKEFIEVKKNRLKDLRFMGYKEEAALKLLKINKNLIENQQQPF